MREGWGVWEKWEMMNTLTASRTWRRAGLFLLLAVAMGFMQWNWFTMPLERDEGEYAYSAWLMRSGKGVPYRDSFLQKPPMIVYTYALVETFAPKSDKVGFRVAGFLASLVTAGLVWKLGKREFGGRAGMWGAWLWAAFAQQMMFSPIAANAEKFMVLPMLGAVALARGGERRGWRWGLAGALAAMSVLYKPICAPVLGAHFTLAIFSRPRKGDAARTLRAALRDADRVLAWLVVGGVAAGFAGLEWFAWKGALGAIWECTVKYTGEYAKLAGSPWQSAMLWWRLIGTWKMWLVLGMAATGALLRWRDGWRWAAVSAVAAVVAMTGLNGHYFLMVLPFFAMLAGAGVERVSAFGGGRRAWQGAFLTFALFAVLTGTGQERRMFSMRPEHLCEVFYKGNPFVEAEAAGPLVVQSCREDETVHVVGSEPEILWYARRKGTTRFDIAYPMTLPTGCAAGYQAETLEVLARETPAAVVVARSVLGIGLGPREVYEGYLRAMGEMLAGEEYRLAWSFLPGRGWVRGGDWAEMERAGASLGVFGRERNVEEKR